MAVALTLAQDEKLLFNLKTYQQYMFTVPGFAAVSCDLVHVKVQDQVDEDSESSRTLDAFVPKKKYVHRALLKCPIRVTLG